MLEIVQGVKGSFEGELMLDSAGGKVANGESRDVTDSARGKGSVVRDDVTDCARGKGSRGET